MKRIQLSVGEFAVPVPRRGSIETHSGYGSLPPVGQELHAILQQQRQKSDPTYEAEVVLRHSFVKGGYEFSVSGRMDGISKQDTPVIEEIKTAYQIDALEAKLRDDPDHPYCLQLKTYGYFYYLQTRNWPKLVFFLLSARGAEGRHLEVPFDLAPFEVWLKLRLEELVEIEKAREARFKRRQKLASQFTFPFDQPRPSQMELIHLIEGHLSGDAPLLVQAPTGLGKTVGVLYPTLKEALSRGQQLIYVTPKNSQHLVVEQAVRSFQKTKSPVKALTLRAKTKMCFKPEPVCNPESCEFARDHYTKMAEHRLTANLAKNKNLTPKKVRALAEKHQVCPFELSLEVIEQADVVIADYNYVFSPRNLLSRFRDVSSSKKRRPNLVIDEFHNLPARAAEYYSPRLSEKELLGLQQGMETIPLLFAREGASQIAGCLEILGSYRPQACQGRIELKAEDFLNKEAEINEFVGRYLHSPVEIQKRDPVLRLAQLWSDFTSALQLMTERFFATYQTDRLLGDQVKITCCDAGPMLAETYGNFAHVVAFSATVKPFEYYLKLSGLGEETRTAEFASPFPALNRKVLVIPQVSTKYHERQRNEQKIAEAIERITALRKGNYFVFFPSFQFMQTVQARTRLPWARVLTQEREMSNAKVKTFLSFLREPEQPTVIFAVQGGVFSEGVDYPGEMVIGALIVGPALPSYDLERELLREYYEREYKKGFDYAYTYPAMTRVVQAAGRVIRSEQERGLIVLMDRRFLADSYTQAMPSEWFDSSVQELVSREIAKDIREFWNAEAHRN